MWALGRSNWRGVQSLGQRDLLSSMISLFVSMRIYGWRLNAEMTICQWWMFAKGLMDFSEVWIWGQLRSTLYSAIWFWSALTLNAPSNFYFIHLHLSPKWQATETWQIMFILENFALRSSSQRSTGITFSRQSCCLLALIYVRLISQSPQFNQLEHAKVTMNVSFKWQKQHDNEALQVTRSFRNALSLKEIGAFILFIHSFI